MSALGVSVDPGKVEAVLSWERPKLVFEIRSFLGLTGYYKWFIEDFSLLATPMTRLTRKEVKFKWNDLCEKVFQELKRRLTSASILFCECALVFFLFLLGKLVNLLRISLVN